METLHPPPRAPLSPFFLRHGVAGGNKDRWPRPVRLLRLTVSPRPQIELVYIQTACEGISFSLEFEETAVTDTHKKIDRCIREDGLHVRSVTQKEEAVSSSGEGRGFGKNALK